MSASASRHVGLHGSVSDACDRLEEQLRHLNSDVVAPLKFPWERSQALSAVFSSAPGRAVDFRPLKMPRVVPPPVTPSTRPGDTSPKLQAPLAPVSKPSAVFEQVLRKPRLDPGARVGADRDNVLRRWLCVLSHEPYASELGGLIWKDGEKDPLGVVAQALAGKATATLLKRVRCCARFIGWGRDHAIAVFPVTLDFAISFLKPLAVGKQSSAIRETLETFNFLQHVVGMKVEPGILANPWIKGAVRGANMRTSDPRRSRVLTTSEVLLLETALIEGHHDRVDRYAIGAFLFQLYARARVSDLRNISKLELDLNDGSGFIEVRTYEHKNSRLGSGAGAVLILVAPYHGLHVQPWGQAWVQAASAVGFAFEKGHRGPILPRLSSDYSWSGDATDANETTRWCRGILAQLTGGPVDETFSSHGLKATPLSWTSKAGYPERTQLILGHHSLGSTGKTQESYAREVQAQPLRDLVECIAAIRRGLFHPDRTRSGMVTQGALGSHFKFGGVDAHDFVCAPPSDSAQSGACELASAEAPRNSPREEAGSPTKDGEASSGCQDDVAEPQSEESESSGDSEGDIVYESFGKGIAQDVIPEVNMGPDLDIFQNPKTKSLHARAKGSTGKLICGRSLDNMETFEGKVFSHRWMCKQCIAGRPVRDIGALNSFLAKKQGRSA